MFNTLIINPAFTIYSKICLSFVKIPQNMYILLLLFSYFLLKEFQIFDSNKILSISSDSIFITYYMIDSNNWAQH